jgi:HD superfamily phosphodiesterase
MQRDFPEIYALALPYLQTRSNELHTRIAYSFAKQLLAEEGGNRNVVLPAVILHDVGWKTIPEDLQMKAFGPGEYDTELNRRHEIEGAAIAKQILKQLHYDPAYVEEIFIIIGGHDSRLTALSQNDAIVKDSDKLWRFSKEALELDPVRFNVDAGKHTIWLGNQINKWFFTDTAKRLALEEQKLRAISFSVPPHQNLPK